MPNQPMNSELPNLPEGATSGQKQTDHFSKSLLWLNRLKPLIDFIGMLTLLATLWLGWRAFAFYKAANMLQCQQQLYDGEQKILDREIQIPALTAFGTECDFKNPKRDIQRVLSNSLSIEASTNITHVF